MSLPEWTKTEFEPGQAAGKHPAAPLRFYGGNPGGRDAFRPGFCHGGKERGCESEWNFYPI